MAEEEHKGVSLVILGIVAIIAVIGLVLLFRGGATGEAIRFPNRLGCVKSPVFSNDLCSGYRCVSSLEVGRACYSYEECLVNQGEGICVKSPAYRGDTCSGYRVMPRVNRACYSLKECRASCSVR